MSDEKLGTFDMGGYLKESGLSLTNVTEDGKYIATDMEGNEGELDVAGLSAELGIPMDKVNIEFNTQDSPLEVSPVSVMGRLDLALGNEAGRVAFLQNKFEDVVPHPDHGLVVKNKGVWQKVDPSIFGNSDPWTMSGALAKGSEILSDAVEFAPEVIDTIGSIAGGFAGAVGGGVAGGALAAPTGPGVVAGVGAGMAAGTVAGSILGGGAAAAVRMSLGRYRGTYQASDEELAKDTGIEALYGLGGEVFGAGVKVGAPHAIKALKAVGETAHPLVKEGYAKLLSFFTGAREASSSALINNPEKIIGEADQLISKVKARNPDAVVSRELIEQEVIRTQMDIAQKSLQRLPQVIGKRFDDAMENVYTNPKVTNFKANISEDVSGILADLQNKGLIEIEETVGKTGNKYKFKATDAWGEAMLENPQAGGLAKRQAANKLTMFVDELSEAIDMGEVTGEEGARIVNKLRRNFDDIYFNATKNDTDASRTLEEMLGPSRAALSSTLVKNFDQAGLGNDFRAANDIWSKNLENIKKAGKIAAKPERVEAFIKDESVSNGQFMEWMSANETPLGKASLARFGEITAASDYAVAFPNVKAWGVRALAGVGVASTVTGNMPTAALAGAAATMASPRMASYGTKTAVAASKIPGNVARAAMPHLENAKNMALVLSPDQRQRVLSDPEAFGLMFGNMLSLTNGDGEQGQ